MAEQENTPTRVGKVVQQATVLFAGAEITAVLAEDGSVYGALPHLSLGEAVGPQVQGPSRFARALKRARMAHGWTQATLATQLAIPKRSIVSWETGERIPSVGMVVLLLDALFPGEELSLHRELLTAYIVDDLERNAQRRDPQHSQNTLLLQRMQRVMAQVLQLPVSAAQAGTAKGQQEAVTQMDEQVGEHELSRPEVQAGEQQALEPLFALMDQLRQHPELIPVARDFLRELAPNE